MNKSILIFLILLSNLLESRENETSAFSLSENSVRIIAAGDVMAHMGQVKSALNSDGTYDFDRTYKYIKNYIESADIAFCNFETVLGKPPYKGYPAFTSPDTIPFALKNAGFDIAFTANNHCLDAGSNGLTYTIKRILQSGMLTSGTFVDSNDKKHRNVIYINKNNLKLAFLNYTYGTNGFKVKAPFIVNYIDTIEIKSTLNLIKKEKPDAIIVFFHWGNEYQRTPDKNQKQIAKVCYENGADVIIGSHPHVVQTIENFEFNTKEGKTKEVLIAYSLGNLISNQYWRYSDGGIFADFTISKDKNSKISITNINYKSVYVYKNYSEGRKNYYLIFTEKSEDLKKELKINDNDLKKIKEFKSDTKKLIQLNK